MDRNTISLQRQLFQQRKLRTGILVWMGKIIEYFILPAAEFEHGSFMSFAIADDWKREDLLQNPHKVLLLSVADDVPEHFRQHLLKHTLAEVTCEYTCEQASIIELASVLQDPPAAKQWKEYLRFRCERLEKWMNFLKNTGGHERLRSQHQQAYGLFRMLLTSGYYKIQS